MRKNLTILFIIIGTIAIISALVYYLGLQGFLFAWVLNFVLMMCVFFFTETLKPKFKSSWYFQKKWEKNGKIYELLGIHFFRKLLVLVGWEKLNKKSSPIEKNSKALMHLEYRTKQSELGHIIIFIIVLGFNGYVAVQFGISESLWLFSLNILLNLYPVFLQRYNRPRLQRALGLSKLREERQFSRFQAG